MTLSEELKPIRYNWGTEVEIGLPESFLNTFEEFNAIHFRKSKNWDIQDKSLYISNDKVLVVSGENQSKD